MSRFNPLDSTLVLALPRRLTEIDSWHEHIPFAFFCIERLQPRLLVELGTWKGDSYCAFCQAVDSLELSTSCYAVDTWKGDEETGTYGPEVLTELRAYHDPLYGSFSRLLEQTFDEAISYVGDKTVDVLHIDGYHSYDAVRHDFETWLPKLSDRGVVLFHDTNVRERNFGVWRLWDEVSEQYPGFAFRHGHGLGVLAVGDAVDPEFVTFLQQAAQPESNIAAFFFAAGSRVALAGRERRLGKEIERSLAAAQQTADAKDAALATKEAELSASRAEIHRLTAELQGVLNSTSWRITAPLRLVDAALHRRRRRRAGKTAQRETSEDPARLRRLTRRGSTDDANRALPLQPLVSVITPVFNTERRWLERAVESVRAQAYARWELCLSDDGSTRTSTVKTLERLARSDPRIKLIRSGANAGISAASNRALHAAEGEFVALLDHDDELDADALFQCIRLLNEKPETDIIYTDEDKIDTRGRRSEPFFKPNWSSEYFRGVMYVGHLLVARRMLVEAVGRFNSEFDGVQDYELVLRMSEQTDRIEHLARTLYHWRKIPGSVAGATDAKAGISELQAAAVNAHLERCGIAAVAAPHASLAHRVTIRPKSRPDWPRVSIVIPTKDAPEHIARCLDSIFSRSTHPDFEVIVVDNRTTDTDALRALERHPIKRVSFEETFNYARANNVGARAATGDYLVLLNNDTEVITPEWLEMLVWHGELPSVGAVGPLLLYPDRTVQHAGVVLGLRGTADHIMRGFPSDTDGYAGSLSCTREVSAVSAACMLTPRGLYEELGGLDEHYQTHYQDVDFCLRVRKSGRRILYTPRATLIHYESASRGDDYDYVDRALLLDAWGDTIAQGDPYYNERLSLNGADYQPTRLAA